MSEPAVPNPQPAPPNPQSATPNPDPGSSNAQYAPPNPQYAPPPAGAAQAQQAPQPSAASGVQRGRRTFAIAALVVAGLELLLGPLNAIVFVLVLRSGANPSLLNLISGILGVVSVVLAIAAIGLAAVSIVRREQARLLAGIAIGIGIAALVGVLATLLQIGLLGG